MDSSFQKIFNILENNQNLQKQYEEKANLKIEQVKNDLAETMISKIEELRYESTKYNTILEPIQTISRKFKYINPELLNLKKSKNKINILLCGFYGAPNMGDELMLQTMLLYLEKNNKFNVTVMLENNSNYDFIQTSNIKCIHHLTSKSDYQHVVNNYDILIFGGGALIDDVFYEKTYEAELSIATMIIDLSKLFIESNKKVIWTALSTSNNLSNKKYINELKNILTKINYVSFRDSNSIKYLKKIGLDTKKIKLSHDIILSHPILKTNKKSFKQNNQIGIILICDSKNQYINEQILNVLKKYNKYKIKLIPFYEYNENDNNYYKNYITKLDLKNVELLEFPKKFETLVEYFNDLDFIISSRYHATLLASILNKKILTIIYDEHSHYENKMNYLYKKYIYESNIVLSSTKDVKLIEKRIDFLLNKQKNNIFNNIYLREAEREMKNLIDFIKE